MGERFQLKQNDIVVVSTAVVTRWNRFLNQLLPTLQTVWYTKAITGK
jgi:polysaccharide export outer membrane protein